MTFPIPLKSPWNSHQEESSLGNRYLIEGLEETRRKGDEGVLKTLLARHPPSPGSPVSCPQVWLSSLARAIFCSPFPFYSNAHTVLTYLLFPLSTVTGGTSLTEAILMTAPLRPKYVSTWEGFPSKELTHVQRVTDLQTQKLNGHRDPSFWFHPKWFKE